MRQPSSLAAMRPGYALYNHRFAPFSARRQQPSLQKSLTWLPAERRQSLQQSSSQFILAAQAQESVEDVALPAWSEPTLPSSEPAPATEAAPLPSAPEPLPSTPAGAITFFICAVAFFRGGVPIFIRSVVFFGKLHHSTDKCDSAHPIREGLTVGLARRTLRWVRDLPHPSRAGFITDCCSRCEVFGMTTSFSVTQIKKSDYYFAIEPQLTLGVGDIKGRSRSYLRLDYMPSAYSVCQSLGRGRIQSTDSPRRRIQHWPVKANPDARRGASRIGKSQQLHRHDGLWANLDASAPTRINIFNTRLRAEYDLTGKLFLHGEFDSYTYFYPNNISDYTVSGGLYLYYRWLPKVSVGIGGTFGYNWVDDPTPNQTFEQVNAPPQLRGDSQIGLVCVSRSRVSSIRW